MKNERIIKNAVCAAKRISKEWLQDGNSVDYKPKIQIYENGYVVSMHHSASFPQNYNLVEKRYKTNVGKKLYSQVDLNIDVNTSDLVNDIIDRIDSSFIDA